MRTSQNVTGNKDTIELGLLTDLKKLEFLDKNIFEVYVN